MASVLHWSINQPFHEFFHQSEFQFFFLYSKRFKIKIFILISSGASAKNKINSPKTAPPYQRSTNPVNPFFVIFPIFLYSFNVSQSVFTLAYNARRLSAGRAFTTTVRSKTIRQIYYFSFNRSRLPRLAEQPFVVRSFYCSA